MSRTLLMPSGARLATLALLFLVMSVCRAALDAVPQTRLDESLRCLLGVYALPSQRHFTLNGADGQPRELAYTFSDGRFGRLRESSAGTFVGDAVVLQLEPLRL